LVRVLIASPFSFAESSSLVTLTEAGAKEDREPFGWVCVEDMKEERAVVGLRRSAVGEAGSVCVVDMTCVRAAPGETRPGEAGDRESGTMSAGFGKVL
jgi:hypothetical protein